MASGGGLTDLILRCLIFGAVPFWKVSPWLLMAQRIYKKVRWARRSLTAFNGRTWEDRDTRELQDIGSSHRLSHRKRERDRLASGVAHARSVPRCVQGSSLLHADWWWRRWSALAPRTRYRSGGRFRRFSESILPSLKAAEYRKSSVQPPPRSPREEDLWLKSIFRMTVRVSCSSGSKSPQPENRKM